VIFSNAQADQLTNTGREAFVTSMTCYTGDYAWADNTTLLTELVRKSSGGAIGGLGGSAISNPTGQHDLTSAFYAGVQAGQRVGDALNAAYAATHDPDVVAQFQLLGDPALRIDLGSADK